MTKIIGALLGMLCGGIASAQAYVSCDGSVVRSSTSDRGRTYSTEVPEIYRAMTQGRGLEYVLTTNWNAVTSAEFRTNLSPDEAVDRVSEILEPEGWHVASRPMRGFRLNVQGATLGLCGGEDRLTAYAEETDLGVCVTVHAQASSGEACMFAGMGIPGGLEPHDVRQYAPLLIAPATGDDEFWVTGAKANLQSPNQRQASYGAEITSEWQAEEILDFYSQQIEDQGWVLDSRWLVESAGGSVWSKQQAGAGNSLSILDIVHLGGGDFRASLRVILPE